MSKKRTNIKIKKSKINIYNKRKNKTRQTVSLIVTIVAACVLCVVGYGIGRPIVNYFNGRGTQSGSESSDNSTVSEVGSSVVSTEESVGTSSTEVVTSQPEPVEKKTELFALPADATVSVEALNSALAAAKEAGYTAVLVTMKDDTGVLKYKSEVSRIKNTASINAGTLSAGQIAELIGKMGMTPAARISTLKDQIAPSLFGSYTLANGTLWLDNTAEAGGKLWLNPFDDATAEYIAELVEELSAAGFKDIVCSNVMFPDFRGYDKDTWLKHLDLRNSEKRCTALWNVTDKAQAAAAKNGAKLWVEMSGDNLIKSEKSGYDAELGHNPDRLKTIPLIADYTASTDVSGVYENAKTFAEKIKTASNGAELVVMVKGLKGAALTDAERAFDEAGLAVCLDS